MEWLAWVVAGLAVALVVVSVTAVVLLRSVSRSAADQQARLAQESAAVQERTTRLDDQRAAFEAERADWRTRQHHERDTLEQERAAWRDELRTRRAELDDARGRAAGELTRIAGLTEAEASAEVREAILHNARAEAAREALGIVERARRDAQRRARGLIVDAIQRVAVEQTAETVVRTLELPSQDMKGRIIGREGRNIRTFEQLTGTNILIDEGNTVTISSFDPVRREKARLMLEALMADGNIHPARIEHEYAKAERTLEEVMLTAAEEALAEVDIVDLDAALIPVLGRLQLRLSHGQNVLRHLVECAHLAGHIAAELGLDVETCKRAAFLHDIGKVLTHEHEGSHAMLGAELLRKHGEHPDIVDAVEAHHNEVEPATVEAVLTQAVDAISGSRPGARRESLEAYLERLENLERIATARPGVARAFAMHAGREVRVMVEPAHVDDAEATMLAHDIAREIEETLSFPGQIRVTVVRESRATATAH